MQGNIFTRSANYANLSPLERAFLRFLALLFWGAVVAGAQAALPLLNTVDPTQIPLAAVAHTFGAAFVVAALAGIGKYHTAQADPPLLNYVPVDHPLAVTVRQPAPLPTAAPTAAAPVTAAPTAAAPTAGPTVAPVTPTGAGQ